ncbi:MAG: TIGR03032 family protein, partial [Planctomycetota bacterium]|nr:TIGR03032 family protein [Planctomycetota bacterium]
MQNDASHFSSTHTPDLPPLLAELGITLAITTYQAGKVIFVSSDGDGLQHLPRTFDTPMGMAVKDNQMALALKDRIVLLANEPRLAASYPNKPNYYDALWVPRMVSYCGELNAHDMAWGEDGLVGVNTLFSCLFRLDEQHSFVPIWQPPFINTLVSEDRCHLNGLALAPGEKGRAVVSALGATNEREGWRDNKMEGGVLMSVPEGEEVLTGLPMPHSPRWIGDELYLLLSARGELAVVDLDEDVFRWTMEVKVTGTFLCSRSVARVLISQGQGGKIV